MKTTTPQGKHATEKDGPRLHHKGLKDAEDKPNPIAGNASLKPDKMTTG